MTRGDGLRIGGLVAVIAAATWLRDEPPQVTAVDHAPAAATLPAAAAEQRTEEPITAPAASEPVYSDGSCSVRSSGPVQRRRLFSGLLRRSR